MTHAAACILFAVCAIYFFHPAAAEGEPRTLLAARSCNMPAPHSIKGVYLPVPNAENPAVLDRFVALAREREINSFVIDVNESGNFLMEHNRRILRRLHDECIWPIARLVAFKADQTWFTDIFNRPLAKNALPRELLRNQRGEVWRDAGNHAWLNPFDRMVWKIAVDMAIYAIDLGFMEIQFDYVRFPTDGRVSEIEFGEPVSSRVRAETITAFMDYAQRRIKTERPWAMIAADIFGEAAMVTSSADPTGNGQNLREILRFVDRIAPMVYPSHWAPGRFGCPIPAECPAKVTRSALAGLVAYVRQTYPGVQICPWLQDFPARNWRTIKVVPYGPREVRLQIDAAEDLGLRCWMLWNPKRVNGGNPVLHYSVEALRLRLPAIASD